MAPRFGQTQASHPSNFTGNSIVIIVFQGLGFSELRANSAPSIQSLVMSCDSVVDEPQLS
jgi:hypothetical protein